MPRIFKPPLTIDIVTLFPNLFKNFVNTGLLGKARSKKLLKIKIHNLRNYARDQRQTVDDKPYGGGAGMILKIEPLINCLKDLKKKAGPTKAYVIFTSASGRKFNQKKAQNWTNKKHLIIFCGRYEGTDERFLTNFVDEEVSIGDYVLNGGEVAALAIVEATSRFIPGFLGNQKSLEEESFSLGLLEYPQYTRPEVYQKLKVPPILLSGNHQKIAAWRKKKALEKTKKTRPDLLTKRKL